MQIPVTTMMTIVAIIPVNPISTMSTIIGGLGARPCLSSTSRRRLKSLAARYSDASLV